MKGKRRSATGVANALLFAALVAPHASFAAADNIVLDPRVTAMPGLPHGPFVRLGDGGIMGVRDADAIVTHDDGKTWERRPIFGPDQKFTIRPERAMLRTRDGAIILIFVNDAVRKYSWDKKTNLPKPDMLLPSYAIRSVDEGKTWTDLTLLHDGWCGCIQDIIQTTGGHIVVPGQELLYDKGRHATMPYVSTDNGKTWQRTRFLDIGGRGDHAGAIEGTLEELGDGRLWMLIRSYHGFFYESFSADHGLTWTDPRPSRIRSTGSPSKMKRLASGRLVLLWNALPSSGFKRREELFISFSSDEGKTWSPGQVIARNKGGRVSYPHVFEHRPGELWITTMQGTLRVSLKERDFIKDWARIVAFGDSTTAPRGRLTLYADLLERELPTKGIDVRVINAGVGSSHTEHARGRFKKDVLAHKPAWVIVQFGINDAAIDVWKKPPAKTPRVKLDRYKANIEYFVETVRAHQINVILMTPNPLRWVPKTRELYGKPPYRPDDPDGFNALLRDYADAVREVAKDKSVALVDIYAQYEAYDRQDGKSMDELLLDGMHPNEKGHRLAADLLIEKLTAGAGGAHTESNAKYLDVVRRTADVILENGRDTYGEQKSGMILSLLDRKTARPLSSLPKAPAGIRHGDRTGLGGSNANLQQDLYRALQHLSRLTGDARYAQAAHAALVDFLQITQHADTGLLAWGEHLYWNCVDDKLGDLDPNKTHEPKRKLAFFDLLYEAEPERTLKYARGLWEHQIADHKTGDFSRHARYHKHAPGRRYDFPKEGSYFIDTWARAYEKMKDPVYAQAVRVLANRYLGRMNGRDLLDFDSSNDPGRVNTCIPLWMVSLAMESHDAAGRLDPETAGVLRKLIARQDRGFLALTHEPADPKRGFIYCAYTNSGKPRPRKTTDGHSPHWGMGYGSQTTSMFGLLCYTRQTQLGPGKTRDAYRRLVIEAADVYRAAKPDPVGEDLWAGEFGNAIFLEIAAHRLTNERNYLDTARGLADEAIRVFWDEDCPLPRASSRTNHYEVITYPDTLILSLLALHEHVEGVEPRVEISDLNR